jgi:hypothetical protein
MMRSTALLLALWAATGAAQPILQAPLGSRPIPVVEQGVVCSSAPNGWTLSNDRFVKPPTHLASDVPRSIDLKVAANDAACANAKSTVKVIATERFPSINSADVTFYPDEGRVELRGARLAGAAVAWSAPPKGDAVARREGMDVCLNPTGATKDQECIVPVEQGLPTDVPLYWVPAHGRRAPEVTTFDAFGSVVPPEAFRIVPGRIILTKPLVQSTGVDLSRGPGVVALTHPEAVAGADCGAATCELADGSLAIRTLPSTDSAVSMRLRLSPRVFVSRGDVLDTKVLARLPVLACPLTAVPGTVLRDAESSALVLKLDASCAHDPAHLLWTVNGSRASLQRVVKAAESQYLLLQTPGTADREVTITGASARLDGTVVASTTARTDPLPTPRASLELEGHGPIDFVPTNRAALVKVTGAGELGHFTLRPIEGAYTVSAEGESVSIRGVGAGGGLVSLRFGYRVPTLPAELSTVDLVRVSERVQRTVREASVPAHIEKLVELVCSGRSGADEVALPNQPYRVAFEKRHTCRVAIHRERLTPEEGTQEIVLKINVTRPDGSQRDEARVDQRLTLRPGGDTRVVPVQGQLGQFDRIFVQVAHVADESRYALGGLDRTGLPSMQRTAIVEGGILRLYALATIPAGLYRVTDPAGQLTLNFGVLSRLALLNAEGQERLIGFELGLVGMGLIPQPSNIHFPPTLALVGGLGLRVPVGPGAAVGVQAWFAYEFRGDITRDLRPDEPVGTDNRVPSSRVSFVFGPSISIGNIGFNL